MHKAFMRMAAALFAGLAFIPAPATAQTAASFVSTTGNDAADCSTATPCRTIGRALSVTAPAGVVVILNSGFYNAATITKSVTIRAVGVEAFIITNTVVPVFTINAGVNDKVVLDGLDIDRANLGGPEIGIDGAVRILQARDVMIRNSRINGFTTNPGYGILIDSPSPVSLLVENTTISNGRTGIRIQSAGGFGAARVYDSTIAGHTVAGISVTGANNRAEIKNTEIVRVPKSLDIVNGAVVYSYGDNVLSAGDAPTLVPKS